MLNALSIRGRLLLTVVMSIGFLTLLAGVNLYGQQRGSAALDSVRTRAVLPLLAIQDMDARIKEVRFNMAGTSLDVISFNGARSHLKDVRDQLPAAWQEFKNGFDAAAANEEERKLVEGIDKEMPGLKTLLDEVDAAYAAEDKTAVAELLQRKWPVVQKKLAKPLSQLVPARAGAVKQTFEASTAEGRRLNMLSIGSYVLCVAGLLMLVLPLIGSLSRAIDNLKATLTRVADGHLNSLPDTGRRDELGDMARSLATTITSLREIIGGVQSAMRQLSGTTQQVSAALDGIQQRGKARSEVMARVSASIDHMSTAARDIADGSGQVAGASNEANGVAADGNRRMEAALAAGGRIETAVEESATVITELSSATDRINQVTQVIREIADQTNLLALNAAIEAARAGEQGRGFAVVADEVRKLAERTSTSTADIASTVQTIRDRTQSAVDAMTRVRSEVVEGAGYNRQTRETLDAIGAAAGRVTGLAQHIAGATQQQMAASEATVRDVAHVAEMSAENSAALDRVEGVTRDMARMAQDLEGLIGRFRV